MGGNESTNRCNGSKIGAKDADEKKKFPILSMKIPLHGAEDVKNCAKADD